MIVEALPLLMVACLIPLIFSGFPVAFVLGGVGFGFWLIAVALGIENDRSFFLVAGRLFGGIVQNLLLVAIPLFIFMGHILERSGVARDLLVSLQYLTRRLPGGLALSVTLLGVIMAATTGIIGASVVMMTVLALPVMVERRYDIPLAAGTIAASGTLGILIPPSIMLIVMADLLSISAGTLFLAAVVPGLMLAGLYLLYISLRVAYRPALAPRARDDEPAPPLGVILAGTLPPLALIVLVLGSIFAGVATPTEASGVGAFGALVLALARGRLSGRDLDATVQETALTTAMIFGLFAGATAFSYVFALLGGHDLIIALAEPVAGAWGVLALLMLIMFVLGFFFDWIEITLIILPVFAPVIAALDFGAHLPGSGMTLAWFAILTALNLQTSFLTPPFGFSLFYMKGAAPPAVSMQQIYRGIVPFVLIQLLGVVLVAAFPSIALWLPQTLSK